LTCFDLVCYNKRVFDDKEKKILQQEHGKNNGVDADKTSDCMVSTYVLSSVACDKQCWNENLWEENSAKILQALHLNKKEINFNELDWYVMQQYPRLYKVDMELSFEDDLASMPPALIRIRTDRVIKKAGFPFELPFAEDKDFVAKAQERSQFFVDVIENRNLKDLTFEDCIKIVGSREFLNFKSYDRHAYNKFINVGCAKMINFLEGKENLPKEKTGEAYLFMKSVVYAATRYNKNLPLHWEQNFFLNLGEPQLDNVSEGKKLKNLLEGTSFVSDLRTSLDIFNRRYREDEEGRKRRENELLQTMKEHTHKVGEKKYHKDATYYGTLMELIVSKYDMEIYKCRKGVAKYAKIGEKARRIIDKLYDRKVEVQSLQRGKSGLEK